MGETVRHAVVGVLTYRRPTELAELLPLLISQAREQTGDSRLVEVLVIDNDPLRSGFPVVTALDDPGVRYSAEPTPGISAARNRALDDARGADVLIFIDDDERPVDGWLGHLISTFERTGAAGVAGAVVPDYEYEPDEWLVAGRFFARRRYPTGTSVAAAGAGNLLLHLPTLHRLGLAFDEDFGMTGGEDTLLTRTLTSRGESILFCDEAVAIDRVPAARMTRGWVLTRASRAGNSTTRVALRMSEGPARAAAVRLQAVAGGAARIVVGVALRGLGLVTGSIVRRARGARLSARGRGIAEAGLGRVHQEYRRA